MKSFLPLLCLALAGCATEIRYPNGNLAALVRSNVRGFEMKGGGLTVKAQVIDNATPTDVASDGITDALATVASGAFAIGAPGASGITRASVLLAPHVTPRALRPPRQPRTPKTVPFTPVGQP